MTPHKGDIRSGELLPVLERATHEELEPIVEALGRSFGINVKNDPQSLLSGVFRTNCLEVFDL
jgi:hypothetical protein